MVAVAIHILYKKIEQTGRLASSYKNLSCLKARLQKMGEGFYRDMIVNVLHMHVCYIFCKLSHINIVHRYGSKTKGLRIDERRKS